MWNFVSPRIVFGDGAIEVLEEVQGSKAFIVTDTTMVHLGLVDRVKSLLEKTGMKVHVFDEVEPDPSVKTVRNGARAAGEFGPDWIIGLGGGSPIDAAKAIWVLYERPDVEPEAIDPITELGLRRKARLIAIPTTSGTGSEVTWGIVLTDREAQRKMGLGNRENLADIAIVDPEFAASMPPNLTADTGLDALVHAVEGYTCTWRNDLTDGLCINAARLVFQYLPRAVADGSDLEARERLHNAATCAGLGFGNAMASMAHAMGHSLGGVFHVPHGRAVSIFLPFTIDFAARDAPDRFSELGVLTGGGSNIAGEAGAREFASRIRRLYQEIGNPATVSATGIEREAYEAQLDKLVDDAFNDTQMLTCVRSPSYEELRQVFVYAYDGRQIDF